MTNQPATNQPGEPRTIIIEKSSGTGTILLAILLLVALVGGLILFNQYNATQAQRNTAIDHAATQITHAVDKAADKADQAVEDAAQSAKKEI